MVRFVRAPRGAVEEVLAAGVFVPVCVEALSCDLEAEAEALFEGALVFRLETGDAGGAFEELDAPPGEGLLTRPV